MSSFYFIIGFVFFFTAIAFIVLLGDLPNYRGTLIHQLHILLVDKFLGILRYHFILIDQKLFNGLLLSEYVQGRIKWYSGWIIPIFYLCIFTKCLQYFFQYTYPQLGKFEGMNQPENLGEIDFRYWIFMFPAIITNYISFILAVLSDPGYIEPGALLSHDQQIKLQLEFPFDNLIFFATECPTCKIEKPARSKHCSTCDKCVLMFDHHCIWLNNDVAYYTYRWFLTFLFSVCYIFLVGGYLCYKNLSLSLKYSLDLPPDIDSVSVLLKYWKLMKQTNFTNEISGIMMLLCMLLFPVVAFFLGEVLWSVYLGVTTNETAKWDYINELVNYELLYEFVPNDGGRSVFLILSEKLPDSRVRFVKLEDRSLFNSVVGGELGRIKGWEDMTNVYDKGFWKNLAQRMFPERLT